MVLDALTWAGPAAAQKGLERIKLEFVERGDDLVVKRLILGPLLFDEEAYDKLAENPLATVIVVRMFVHRKGSNEPVGFHLLSARVVYDLWLEKYEVRIDGPAGREGGKYKHLPDAYKAITEIGDIPVAKLADVAIGPHHYLDAVIELNPVSEETQAEMRRWLARPAGTANISRGTSFFGSFVSIFVNAKLPAADRVVRARSQPFYRVPR